MWSEFRRGFVHGLGFWLAPLALALIVAGGGMAAGFASAASSPPPTPVPGAPAVEGPQRNGAVGQVIRLGPVTPEGRLIVVRDRSDRLVRVLVTPQTVVKKNGRRVAPAALRVGDYVAGFGTREANGVFRARGLAVVDPPAGQPTPVPPPAS